MKLILVVSLAAVLFTADFTDSAAIKSDDFGEQLLRILQDGDSDSMRIQRAAGNVNEEPKRYCYDTACGWHSYNKGTRRTTDFMRSTCTCPDESYKCVRTGDNVSIGAYVYHCRQNTTPDDIEGKSPEDGESSEYGS